METWLRETEDEVQIDDLLRHVQTLVVMGSTYVNDTALETGACVQSYSVNADGTVNLTLTKGSVRVADEAGEDQTVIRPNVCRAMMTAALNDQLSLEVVDVRAVHHDQSLHVAQEIVNLNLVFSLSQPRFHCSGR